MPSRGPSLVASATPSPEASVTVEATSVAPLQTASPVVINADTAKFRSGANAPPHPDKVTQSKTGILSFRQLRSAEVEGR